MLGLGTMQGVQAQTAPQISGATQVQSNQVETYYSDYFCDDVPKRYSVNWGVSGGTILAQTELYVTVRWNANVSNGTVNMSVTGSCASAFQSCCASLAINIQQPMPPVTISGRILNQNGQGASGVSVSNGSTATSTDGNGYYSFTVPSGWSGSISATPPACNGISITSLGFNNLTSSITNQDFNLTPPFQISYSQTNYTILRMHPAVGTWRYVITYTDGTSQFFDECRNDFYRDNTSKLITKICVYGCGNSCSQCD